MTFAQVSGNPRNQAISYAPAGMGVDKAQVERIKHLVTAIAWLHDHPVAE
jgi:hypothetical protein